MLTYKLCKYIPTYLPTYPFTILEPHDQEIGEFYIERTTDFEAPKL